ncbi:MAG: hypothetical protein V3U59_08420, partial [Gammaproteobacteria bacterium]
ALLASVAVDGETESKTDESGPSEGPGEPALGGDTAAMVQSVFEGTDASEADSPDGSDPGNEPDESDERQEPDDDSDKTG